MLRQRDAGVMPSDRAGRAVLRSRLDVFIIALFVVIHSTSVAPVCAALISGAYQSIPGATVEEWGDRVPNGRRVVPVFANLHFELNSVQTLLTALITNAVLEGGNPFPLTVHSSWGSQMADGTYSFRGDYLAGTQYLYDWQFSPSTNSESGEVVWNGMTGWAGGHAWYITISNLTLAQMGDQLFQSPFGVRRKSTS